MLNTGPTVSLPVKLLQARRKREKEIREETEEWAWFIFLPWVLFRMILSEIRVLYTRGTNAGDSKDQRSHQNLYYTHWCSGQRRTQLKRTSEQTSLPGTRYRILVDLLDESNTVRSQNCGFKFKCGKFDDNTYKSRRELYDSRKNNTKLAVAEQHHPRHKHTCSANFSDTV